ncbi:MAG: shikimate dehydrogenase, partial [Myxococcota bacterium]
MSGPGLPLVFGVFGYPVAHSRSPAMHQAALAVLGLPHTYQAFAVRPKELEAALQGARALGLGGLNLTVPHKRPAVELMDALTETAKRIGAVNTVLVEPSRLVGDNTDAIGFARALRELGGAPIKRAVLLGAGGASRAIIDALRRPPKPRAGAPWEPLRDPVRVTWVSRRVDVLPKFPGVTPVVWDEVNEVTKGADLLINATTVGMKHGPVG